MKVEVESNGSRLEINMTLTRDEIDDLSTQLVDLFNGDRADTVIEGRQVGQRISVTVVMEA